MVGNDNLRPDFRGKLAEQAGYEPAEGLALGTFSKN